MLLNVRDGLADRSDLPSRERPAFVIGLHRSGTTLVRYILDAHPRLVCPPETKFIPALQAFVDYPQALSALQSLGFRPAEVARHLRRFIEGFLAEHARAVGKARWIDKTPNHHNHLDFLDEVFAAEPLYLWIVRYPLDCIASLESFFMESVNHEDPEIAAAIRQHGRGRFGWARHWAEVHERIAAFQAAVGERCLTLRYEDLVLRTQSTVEKIFRFLGEECPAEIVAEAFLREHSVGFEDDMIRSTNGIHAASLGRSSTWNLREALALWEVVGPAASRFGYSSPIAGEAPT